MVASYSYSDTVKPVDSFKMTNSKGRWETLAVNFVLILHDQKWVIVKITEELDVRSVENSRVSN
jgi:hypothetical protein